MKIKFTERETFADQSALIRLALDGRILAEHEGSEHFLKVETLYDRNWCEFLVLDDQKRWLAAVEELRHSAKTGFQETFRFLANPGHERWLRHSVTLVHSNDQPSYLLLELHDMPV